jgi:hypothetical protein
MSEISDGGVVPGSSDPAPARSRLLGRLMEGDASVVAHGEDEVEDGDVERPGRCSCRFLIIIE